MVSIYINKPKVIACISPESARLFTDSQLIRLLVSRGVDVTRKTRVDEHGLVYYL